MGDAIDFFMVVGFVFLTIYLLRGFMLQVQEREEERKRKK